MVQIGLVLTRPGEGSIAVGGLRVRSSGEECALPLLSPAVARKATTLGGSGSPEGVIRGWPLIRVYPVGARKGFSGIFREGQVPPRVARTLDRNLCKATGGLRLIRFVPRDSPGLTRPSFGGAGSGCLGWICGGFGRLSVSRPIQGTLQSMSHPGGMFSQAFRVPL